MRRVVAVVVPLVLVIAACGGDDDEHGYVFTLYALDEQTGLEGGATVYDLRAAIDGHVFAEAVLTAPYARS